MDGRAGDRRNRRKGAYKSELQIFRLSIIASADPYPIIEHVTEPLKFYDKHHYDIILIHVCD